MKLENIVRPALDFVRENKSFSLASGLYLLTATADAYMTARGVNMGVADEWNPIGKLVMDQLGAETGAAAIKCAGIPALVFFKSLEGRMDKSIAHLPIYLVSLAQGLAAATWGVISDPNFGSLSL